MELDCRGETLFRAKRRRNGSPRTGSRGARGSDERGRGEKRIEPFRPFLSPSLSSSPSPARQTEFHRVMRLTIGVKRSVMRHSISSRASALFTLCLCRRFNATLLGLFNRPIPIGGRELQRRTRAFFLLLLSFFLSQVKLIVSLWKDARSLLRFPNFFPNGGGGIGGSFVGLI